jgi:hypothetical protein
MNRRTTIACWFVVAFVLTALAGRALWLASKTEIGLELIRDQWMSATTDALRGPRIPVYSQEPIEQAEFWLREVNRLGQQNSNDAECAIGAAWVLDSPSSGYLPKFIKEFHTYPGGSNIPQLDEEGDWGTAILGRRTAD